MEDKTATEQIANSKQLVNDSLKAITTEPKDSLDMKPVVFDNAELGDNPYAKWQTSIMLMWSMSTANTQHVRLFFQLEQDEDRGRIWSC